MFKKKVLVIALALAMMLGGVPLTYAVDAAPAAEPVLEFADMPADNYWSTGALQAAVDNGLLNGFTEGEETTIRPKASLTRAQMAAIVNRAFGASVEDPLTIEAFLAGDIDVQSTAWYASDMAKAVHMGTFMLDSKMRPEENITRQEAFAVLARAFKLKDSGAEYTALNQFSDKNDISPWAAAELSGMAAAGYIQGSDGMLKPLATITRQEFATVMDNMVKQYIDKAGTYRKVAESGNVMIRVSGVVLKGATINGDLIVADGVGAGEADFQNIKVTGRLVIRGGGENSITFSGFDTDIPNIIIARGSDGKVRIITEDGLVLAEAEISGDGEVILQGNFGNINVTGDGVKLIISKGTTVDSMVISGADASISGPGELTEVLVASGGQGASITTPDTVITVDTGVTGVTAGGGTPVTPGETVTNNEEGDGIVEEIGFGGGGGGGVLPPAVPTPVLSITEITVDNGAGRVDPAGSLYVIPPTADETNTAIDIEITNTADVAYAVTLTIKNSSDLTVATASSAGLDQVYIDLLSVYEGVTFYDLSRMFDRLGTSPSGYYLDAAGNQVSGSTLSAFEDSVTAAFARMSDGEIYEVTVTATPTGGSAGSLSFEVRKGEV
jgi:hypothetical protein